MSRLSFLSRPLATCRTEIHFPLSSRSSFPPLPGGSGSSSARACEAPSRHSVSTTRTGFARLTSHLLREEGCPGTRRTARRRSLRFAVNDDPGLLLLALQDEHGGAVAAEV